MKKLSSSLKNRAKPSPFKRIVARGQEKVHYKPKVGKLIMSLSSEDHERIAVLIRKWLKESD
ncbi:hypothetical protein KUL49_35370 [Alteromonas sp. KUL49]|nr:hypothetical protein EYS00_17425 [Alteromonas sp. KUL49]GEA13162.1 hypothetical protein KUL49_35370 [Alteromonas sp. KUL49]